MYSWNSKLGIHYAWKILITIIDLKINHGCCLAILKHEIMFSINNDNIKNKFFTFCFQ